VRRLDNLEAAVARHRLALALGLPAIGSGAPREKGKNRSFELPEALMDWTKPASPDAQGEFAVGTDRPPCRKRYHVTMLASR
jgi:hypothetical protein